MSDFGKETKIDLVQCLDIIDKMAKELSDLDPISDAIYTLRAEVFADLKSEGFIPVEADGPDYQSVIDAVIVKLFRMV